MRQNGNAAVNRIYNPRNVQPAIPIDMDETDAAMERFIRQKYQERSLADGKPRPPSRDATPPPSKPPPANPPTEIKSAKRGKIFGFKLRASSSAFPVSKRGDRDLPPIPPTVENVFDAEIRSDKPPKTRLDESSGDKLLQAKLSRLQAMGFQNNERNRAVLARLSGDMSKTVESLVRLGEGADLDSMKSTPVGSQTGTPSKTFFPESVKAAKPGGTGWPPPEPNHQLPSLEQSSLNASCVPPAQNQLPLESLNQAFNDVQISQPLFPHSTGGYPRAQPAAQDPRFQHSMTPPVPQVSRHHDYHSTPASANSSTNPFLRLQNPYHVDAHLNVIPQNFEPTSAPATNPFFNQQLHYSTGQHAPFSAPLQPHTSGANPYGAPVPEQQSYWSQSTPLISPNLPQLSPPVPQQTSNPRANLPQPQASSSQQAYAGIQPAPIRPQPTGRLDKKSILALYNLPQFSPQPVPTISDDGALARQASPSNDAASDISQSSALQEANLAHNPMSGVQLGAKRSATMPMSALSPSSAPPIAAATAASPEDSPAQGSKNASGAGIQSRNPFLNGSNAMGLQNGLLKMSDNSTQPTTQSPHALSSPAPAQVQNLASSSSPRSTLPFSTPHPPPSIMQRTASRDSVAVGNASNLDSGRHSPDIFANLSARFV